MYHDLFCHVWAHIPSLQMLLNFFKNRNDNTSLLLPSQSVTKTICSSYKLLLLFSLFAAWKNEEVWFPRGNGRADRFFSPGWPCSYNNPVPQSPGGLAQCFFQPPVFLPPVKNCDHRWKAAAQAARDNPELQLGKMICAGFYTRRHGAESGRQIWWDYSKQHC